MTAITAEKVAGTPLSSTQLFGHLRAHRYTLVLSGALFCWLSVLAFILPYDPDEAVFKIIATGIIDGQWPYRDLFDHKPPLIYAWYLPAGFGASIELQRVLAAALMAATVPVLRIALLRWMGEREIQLTLLCYFLLLANPFLQIGAHTEAFMLLPLIGAMAVGSPVIAGALLGVAVMTKPTALLFAPMLVLIWKRQSWQAAAGTIAMCAAVAAPFVFIWDDFWAANVTFNLEYGGYLSNAERLRNVFSFHPLVLLGALPIWIAVVIGMFGERRAFVWLWALCAVLAWKLTSFDFAHYYGLIVAPAAVLAASGVDRWISRRRSFGPRFISRLSFATTAGASGLLVVIAIPMAVSESDAFGDTIRAIKRADGELYVLGDRSQIYVLADRQPERRLFFHVPMAVGEPWSSEARASLEACPPDVLVVPASLFRVEWRRDIAAMYAFSRAYEGAVVYTSPMRECSRE